MAVSVPANVIAAAQAADSELWQIMLAISYYESGYCTNNIGDAGCSIGCMQMNMCGGLGTGHSKEELLDPYTNFRLAAQHIRADLANGRTLYEALWPWQPTRDRAWPLYDQMVMEGVVAGPPVETGGGNGSGGSGQAGGSGASQTAILLAIGLGLVLLVVLSS